MDFLNVFQHFTGNPGDPNLIAVILAFLTNYWLFVQDKSLKNVFGLEFYK